FMSWCRESLIRLDQLLDRGGCRRFAASAAGWGSHGRGSGLCPLGASPPHQGGPGGGGGWGRRGRWSPGRGSAGGGAAGGGGWGAAVRAMVTENVVANAPASWVVTGSTWCAASVAAWPMPCRPGSRESIEVCRTTASSAVPSEAATRWTTLIALVARGTAWRA